MNKRRKKKEETIESIDISTINDNDVIKYLDEIIYNDPGFMDFYKSSNDPKLQCANLLILTNRWFDNHSTNENDKNKTKCIVNNILNCFNDLIAIGDDVNMINYIELGIVYIATEWVKYKYDLLSLNIDKKILAYIEKCLGLITNIITGYDPYIINRLFSIEVVYDDEDE